MTAMLTELLRVYAAPKPSTITTRKSAGVVAASYNAAGKLKALLAAIEVEEKALGAASLKAQEKQLPD